MRLGHKLIILFWIIGKFSFGVMLSPLIGTIASIIAMWEFMLADLERLRECDDALRAHAAHD